MHRRNLLKGVAAGTLSLSLSQGVCRALQQKASSAHNGGRSQIQSWFLQVGGDYPFINLMKTAQNWSISSGPNKGRLADPAALDLNGYPTNLKDGPVFTVFFVPSAAARPGNYIATWRGNATIYCGMNNRRVSGNTTGTGGAGRYVFSTSDSRFVLGVSSLNNSFIADLRVFHSDDEDALKAGEIFGARFKFLLQQAKPGVVRFLDWMGGNICGITNWNTRKPIDYYSYAASEFRHTSYAGETTHVGVDYSVPFLGSSALVDKQIVQVRFDADANVNQSTVKFEDGSPDVKWLGGAHGLAEGDPIGFQSANFPPSNLAPAKNYYVLGDGLTSTTFRFSEIRKGRPMVPTGASGGSQICLRLPTLTLNGTSPIPIRDGSGDITARGGNTAPRLMEFATLTFDAALGSFLKTSGGIQNGVPPEIMVALCAEIGAHPFFVAPMLACDPISDWFPNLATYIRKVAPGWMIPRFEGPNELWNYAGGFLQTRYAWNKAAVTWAVYQQHHDWYGKIISMMGQAVSAVYGDDRTKYQILCGVQSSTYANCRGSDARLKAIKYVADGGSAAYNWVTHVCVTNYINPVEQGTLEEFKGAFEYAIMRAEDRAAQTELISRYVNKNTVSTGELARSYAAWRSWGAGMPIPVERLCAYEGGWSPDYVQQNSTASSTISAATQNTPCILTLPTTNLFGHIRQGNPAVSGMHVTLSDMTAPGWFALNGKTFRIASVAGNEITIELDTSGLPTFSGKGTATFVGSANGFPTSSTIVNVYRKASKFVSSLEDVTLKNYLNLNSIEGGEFPSCYVLGGKENIWSVWDPDIYASTASPQWRGIVAFNR